MHAPRKQYLELASTAHDRGVGEENEDQGDVVEQARPPLDAARARSITAALREAMGDVGRSVAVCASRRTFSLAGLYEVVYVWQGRRASAPAFDAFVASSYDNSGFVDMAELRGRRR